MKPIVLKTTDAHSFRYTHYRKRGDACSKSGTRNEVRSQLTPDNLSSKGIIASKMWQLEGIYPVIREYIYISSPIKFPNESKSRFVQCGYTCW